MLLTAGWRVWLLENFVTILNKILLIDLLNEPASRVNMQATIFSFFICTDVPNQIFEIIVMFVVSKIGQEWLGLFVDVIGLVFGLGPKQTGLMIVKHFGVCSFDVCHILLCVVVLLII